MATSERILKLVFTGRDESGQAVKSVTQSLRELKQAVRTGKEDLTDEKQAYDDSIKVLRERAKEERLLKQEFREKHQEVYRTIGIMNQVGSAGLKVNQIFMNHNLLQQRIAQSNKDVSKSYKEMQDAISTYGAGSQQAADKQDEFNKALQESKNLANESNMQYLTSGLALTSIVGDALQIAERIATRRKKNAGGNVEDISTRTNGNSDGGFDPLTGLLGVEAARTIYSVFGRRGSKVPTEKIPTSDVGVDIAKSGSKAIEDVKGGRGLGKLGKAGAIGTGALLLAELVNASAGDQIDAFLEDHGINVLRNLEDRYLAEKGLPDQFTSKEEFYKDYDQRLASGSIHINEVKIYTNEMSNAQQLQDNLEGIGRSYQQQ